MTVATAGSPRESRTNGDSLIGPIVVGVDLLLEYG